MGWRSPFKVDGDGGGVVTDSDQKKKRCVFIGNCGATSDSVAVGLRILIHLSKGNSNYILVKSKLKLTKPNFQRNRIPSTHNNNSPPQYSCFLKSCFLCNKTLSPHKDVYMYRGDQGFCSQVCRNRQIYVDEIREIDISTKKMLASSSRKSQYYGGGGGGVDRCEDNILQEELRHLHKPQSQRHRASTFNYFLY